MTQDELLDSLTTPADQFTNSTQPVASTTSMLQAENAAEDAEGPGVGEFVGAAIDRDFVIPAVSRFFEENGFEEDPTFVIPEPDTADGKKFWEGIDTQDLDQFDPVSQAHMDHLRGQYEKNKELEATLASAGVPGAAARFGLNLLDPVGLTIGLASGGAGVLTKAGRLERAVQAGLISGAASAAYEIPLAAGSMDRDATDVAIGTLFGIGLGGIGGAAFRNLDTARWQNAVGNLSRDMRAQEIVEAAAKAGQKLTHEEAVTKLAAHETGDSAGAARASIPTPIRDDEDFVEATLARNGTSTPTAFAKARLDYASVVRGDEDLFVQSTVALYADDPVGNADHSVSRLGATAEASRISKIRAADFAIEADKQFEKWRKRNGHSWLKRFDPKLRDDFMREVGLHARGVPGTYSDEAKALASKSRSIYEQYRNDLIETGVMDKGVDGFGMQQAWDHELIEDLIHGLNGRPKLGTDQVARLVANSMRRTWLGATILDQAADPVKADRALERLGRGFLKRIREVGRGIDMEVMHGVSAKDVDYIRELMQEVGTDPDTIGYVESAIKRSLESSSTDGGKPSLAKHRTQFDHAYRERLLDTETGERIEFGISDLMENNAEILFHKYNKAASGRVALARVAGVTSDRDHQKIINEIKNRISDPDRRDRIVNASDDIYNYLVGRPLEKNPNGAYARFARYMRNFNMARLGSTFGIAQIGDLGNVAAVGGIRGLIGGIPEFRSILNQLKTKNYTDDLVRELTELGGLGLDHLSTTMHTSEYDDLFGSRMGKVDFALRTASRAIAVGSGMTKINEWSQVLVGKLIVQRFANGRAFSAKRLATLGLTSDEGAAVKAALKKHGTFDGRTVQSMNIHSWDDQKLAAKFISAVRKSATRAVQENDFGATLPIMHNTTGKLISQFRSFMMVAWSKQTLHNLHARDWDTFSTMAWGLFFGGLSYAAYVASAVPSDKWEERLSPPEIAAAAFSRAGWVSILPMAIDTPITTLGFDPIMANRASGLPSNAFSGIATVEAVDRAYRLISGGAQGALGNKEFTQKDIENARRLTIGGNFFGVAHLSNLIGEGLNLPEE